MTGPLSVAVPVSVKGDGRVGDRPIDDDALSVAIRSLGVHLFFSRPGGRLVQTSPSAANEEALRVAIAAAPQAEAAKPAP
ncbi:hypothetical protein ACFC00_29995 [Streptomyces adustus]|uniref:hypothetical protein n=1 Tax=Streptomyces adustus TaxID=1609272 RepID=UPI0035DF621F